MEALLDGLSHKQHDAIGMHDYNPYLVGEFSVTETTKVGSRYWKGRRDHRFGSILETRNNPRKHGYSSSDLEEESKPECEIPEWLHSFNDGY
jgi:hypothetical protein